MSHEAKGLFPLAGGLGMPEAWCTAVVPYGPADAGASGMKTIKAKTTAAVRGMPLPMAHLHRSKPKQRPIFPTCLGDVKQIAGADFDAVSFAGWSPVSPVKNPCKSACSVVSLDAVARARAANLSKRTETGGIQTHCTARERFADVRPVT